MFLVELSYNTIKEEIKDLELKKQRKEASLLHSEKQLKDDNKKLDKHIEDDKVTTSNKVKEAE